MNKEYKIGDTYWYVAVGNGNRLKVYNTLIVSGQDFDKGMARFDTRKEAEEYMAQFEITHPPSYWQLLGELEGTLQTILDAYNPTESVRESITKRLIELKLIKPEDITVSVLSDFSQTNRQ
jgi:hypothetical protein